MSLENALPTTESQRTTARDITERVDVRPILALMLSAFIGLGVLYGGGGVLWNDVIDAFGISKGAFGVASGLGIVASFPVLLLGGRVADRVDKRLVLSISLAVAAVAAIGMVFGSGFAVLTLILVVQGLGVTALDLSNNALAMDFERATRRHIMGPLHASFSVGSLFGPLAVWLVLWLGGTYRAMYTLFAILFLSLSLFAWRSMTRQAIESQPPKEDQSPLHSLHLLRAPALRDLAIITGIAFAAELLIAQWVGIYFQDERAYSSTVTVIALSLNGGAMAIGRFGNGPFTARFGARRSLFIQGALTFAGGLLLVAGSNAAVAIVGCGIAGLGLAGMVPTVLSLAGIANPTAPGAASGAILFVGYAGIALAPFMSGAISTVASTRIALIGVAAGGLAVVYIARRVTTTPPHLEEPIAAVA